MPVNISPKPWNRYCWPFLSKQQKTRIMKALTQTLIRKNAGIHCGLPTMSLSFSCYLRAQVDGVRNGNFLPRGEHPMSCLLAAILVLSAFNISTMLQPAMAHNAQVQAFYLQLLIPLGSALSEARLSLTSHLQVNTILKSQVGWRMRGRATQSIPQILTDSAVLKNKAE